MKVPDKLYIGRRNYGPLIGGWKSQPFTSKEIESIEYIRKDALMEWLEQNRNQSQMWFDRYYEREDLSAKQVWEKVIEKLNSI